MDFDRWGMQRAQPTFRDTAHDGFNIMHKLSDRPDWFGPQPGREHHRSWHQILLHPDAVLMQAAPTLLEAAETVLADLTARIDQAGATGQPIPLFRGIADLHAAINLARGA